MVVGLCCWVRRRFRAGGFLHMDRPPQVSTATERSSPPRHYNNSNSKLHQQQHQHPRVTFLALAVHAAA
jgi:hypothetical protein